MLIFNYYLLKDIFLLKVLVFMNNQLDVNKMLNKNANIKMEHKIFLQQFILIMVKFQL